MDGASVDRAAARLRQLHNVCGDDRGCQCEEAVAESRRLAREMLEAATDLPEVQFDPRSGLPTPLPSGMRLIDYDIGLIAAAADSWIVHRGHFRMREIKRSVLTADPTLRGRRWTRAWHEVRHRYETRKKRIAGRNRTVFVPAQQDRAALRQDA